MLRHLGNLSNFPSPSWVAVLQSNCCFLFFTYGQESLCKGFSQSVTSFLLWDLWTIKPRVNQKRHETEEQSLPLFCFFLSTVLFQKTVKTHGARRSRFAYHRRCYCHLHLRCQAKNNVNTASFHQMLPVWLVQFKGGWICNSRRRKQRGRR